MKVIFVMTKNVLVSKGNFSWSLTTGAFSRDMNIYFTDMQMQLKKVHLTGQG